MSMAKILGKANGSARPGQKASMLPATAIATPSINI